MSSSPDDLIRAAARRTAITPTPGESIDDQIRRAVAELRGAVGPTEPLNEDKEKT